LLLVVSATVPLAARQDSPPPSFTSPDALFAHGNRLLVQGTPESLHEALSDFKQAVAAWQKTGEEAKQLDALLAMASTHFYLHDLSNCQKSLEQANQLAAASQDKLGEAKVAFGFALFYDAQRDEPKALEEASRSAQLFHASAKPAEEAQALFFLAMVYQKTNDLPNAIAAYERTLPVAGEAKNAQLEALTAMRLGQLYNLQSGDTAHEKAVAFFEKALPYFETSKDRFNQAMSWWGIATAYDWLKNIESARAAYVHANELAAERKDNSLRGRLLRSLGHDEVELKLWSEAAQHLEQAILLLTAPADNVTRFLAGIDLGTAREQLNDKTGAIKAYETTAEGCQRAGLNNMAATAWLKTAGLHEKSFHWEAAIAASTKAVAAARAPSGASMLPAALTSLSNDYLNSGQHAQSLETSLQVLPLLEGKYRVNTLIVIGINYSWLAQYAKALEYLNQGLSASSPNSAERAGLLAVLAEVHTSLNNLTTAAHEAEEARDIFHTLNIPNGEAKALNQLGLVYQAIGNRSKSETALNAALANERANANSWGEASTLNNLGDIQRYFGDARKAEPLYQQALAIATHNGDAYQQASILHNLGLSQHALGKETESLATLQRALTIRRQLKDPNDEAKVLSAIGMVLLDTGQPQEGFNYLLQSLKLLEGTEDFATRASVLDNMGSTYRYLGSYRDAETYFQKAQDLSNKMSDDISRATILNNLATLELTQALEAGASEDRRKEGLTRASELYGDALGLLQKTGDKFGQAHILISQAMISSEQGRQQEALLLLQRSKALVLETGDIDIHALLEHNTGTVYAKLGDSSIAIQHYRLALPLWRQIGRTDGEEQTQYVIAKAERKAGHLDLALTHVQDAIRLSSALGRRVHTDEQRSSMFATTSSYYEFEIDLLMQLAKLRPGRGYEAQAFEASERSRARSLLDLLAEAHADIRQGVDAQLLAQEKSIERSLAAKEAVRLKLAKSPDTEQGQQALKNEITALRAEYETVQSQIRAKSPAYATLTQPLPLSVKDIQAEVLEADSVLLEYAFGQDRSYLWAITANSIHTYILPPRLEIEKMARRLNTRILDKDPPDDEAAYLSRILLAQAAKDLKHRIVVVADGELQRSVPFAILPDPEHPPGEPLLLNHEVITEPSASAVALLRRNNAGHADQPKLVAMIADPVFGRDDERLQQPSQTSESRSGLPAPSPGPSLSSAGLPDTLPRLKNSGEEARAVLELTRPGQSLAMLGFDANKTAVENARLSDYRVVHFATHGLLNFEHPSLSALALSLYDKSGSPIDGFLTLSDVYNLRLPVKLVVLSACESGQGQLVRGEGIVGLSRGFMYAGAASLIVSLWNVNDQSTAELMRRFYRSYLSDNNARPAAALRAAQLSMLQEERWRLPYYWAAFTLEGDWR
jgi:CHAT domain-containing protein